MAYTILRFANVYGPGQGVKGEGGVVSIFTRSARNNEIVNVFGDGEQTRDFIYVKDVVSAAIQCLQYGDHETLNIGTSQPTSVNELLSIIEKVIDTEVTVNYKNAREGDILHSYFTNEKAKTILKWEPNYSLQQGVLEMFEIVPN
jgi:UDP-glucose 4-epimerase